MSVKQADPGDHVNDTSAQYCNQYERIRGKMRPSKRRKFAWKARGKLFGQVDELHADGQEIERQGFLPIKWMSVRRGPPDKEGNDRRSAARQRKSRPNLSEC